MSYVVGSKVKDLVKKNGCNTAGDFVSGLSGVIEWYLEEGCSRAKANGRKTVRANDVLTKGSADTLVVGSKIKAYNKEHGCNTAGDLVGGLSAVAAWNVDMACKRAKANGRKTARAADL